MPTARKRNKFCHKQGKVLATSETSTTAGSSPRSVLPSPSSSIANDTPREEEPTAPTSNTDSAAASKLDEESGREDSGIDKQGTQATIDRTSTEMSQQQQQQQQPSASRHVDATMHLARSSDTAAASAKGFEDDKVWAAVTSFQAGERACNYWNGDVAAGEGHLSLMTAKHLATDPLSYSHLALNRAAKNGRLDVVRWLHDYTDVPQTGGAMDSAAAGGHLGVRLMGTVQICINFE